MRSDRSGVRREQALLTRLALATPRPVPVDQLIHDVWGEHRSERAVDSLRVHVSTLRKLLSDDRAGAGRVLSTGPSSYRLDLPSDAIDLTRLESAVRQQDRGALRRLLTPWPDHDLGRHDPGTGYFEAAARRLDDLLVGAAEVLASRELDDGLADAAASLLEIAVGHSPHRERLWALLVRALLAADRRADALRAFQRSRRALAEIGLDPGPALSAAEAEVLAAPTPDTRDELVTRYVEIDGSRVAYGSSGNKPVDLLFLHGGFVPFETMRDTPRLAAFLDNLGRRFRVLFLDRRGIGMSDDPADGSPITLDHWVDDCIGVLDAVGSRRVVVFGHEHGGPVAIRLAAEVPDRVVGVVLHSTAARPLRSEDHPYGPTEATLERLDRMIDQLPGSEDMLRLVAPSAGEDRALRAWLDRAGRLGASSARARELHRLYLSSDVRDALGAITAPAVVLHPARLVRTDPGQARFIAERLADAELVLLNSADHIFWLADAPDVLAAVDRLCSRLPTSPGSTMAPMRLRALVAVTPIGPARALAEHRPATSVTIDDVVVATFDSLSIARLAASAVTRRHPNAATLVEAADTTGDASDVEVLRCAAAVSALRHRC